jgi:hypothetical protein
VDTALGAHTSLGTVATNRIDCCVFTLEVRQNLLDPHKMFNAGKNLDGTAEAAASLARLLALPLVDYVVGETMMADGNHVLE